MRVRFRIRVHANGAVRSRPGAPSDWQRAPAGETLVIHGYPRGQRIYAVCVFAAAAAFFGWVYWANRAQPGSWTGLILIGGCLWVAAYWARLPRVLGVLTPRGLHYRKEDLGLLFWYPWFHTDWDRVREVQTFKTEGRGAPELVTQLRFADPRRPGKLRTFRISTENCDYYRFVEYLRGVVDPAALAQGSLPLEPTLLRRQLRAEQLRKLGALALLSVALVIVAYLLRR